MSYQQLFPEVLEKTYRSCKRLPIKELPFVDISSIIFREKIISLPFLDTVNLNNISKENIDDLIKKSQGGKIEIRLSESNNNLIRFKKILSNTGFNEAIVKGHVISDLTTEKDFWKRFHKHTRNDIRKAEKSGLDIKKIDSKEELKNFYRLYFKQMKKFGTPSHSFKFFKNCFEIMKKDFFGLNCYLGKKLIGSIIFFLNNDYAYVSFNVSNEKFKNLRPNDLLYWEALKWCMENKIGYFDIGQIDLNPEKGTRAEALLKFKKKWLGNEYKKIYFTRGFKYSQSKKENLKKFRKVWSKLPSFIIKIIGPAICSQLG